MLGCLLINMPSLSKYQKGVEASGASGGSLLYFPATVKCVAIGA